jgi:hypothetical protein
MDGLKFDAWTRRGFGVAASGLAGSLLALSAVPKAKAKKGKKKKKDKCLKFGDSCNPSGNKECCCPLACQENLPPASGHRCCFQNGEPCTAQNGSQKCCSGVCAGATMDVPGHCLCKTNGQGCSADNQCCTGFCDNGTGGSNQCEPLPNDPN